MDAVASALIGSITAVVVLGIGRALERRHATQAWLRDETLAAVADFLSAYNTVITAYLGVGGRWLSDLELRDHLVQFQQSGGQKLNSAYSRITLLGDDEIVGAAKRLGDHIDACFNASYKSEMKDLATWRGQLLSGSHLVEELVATTRRRLGASDLASN